MKILEFNSQNLLKPPRLILGIDPGKSTGWVVFENGVIKAQGIDRSVDAFIDTLDTIDITYGVPDLVVMEKFVLFKHKALQQSGSELEASQIIGMVKRQAKKWGAKLVIQHSNILPVAQIWSKLPMPSNHRNSHWISAYNHVVYYLVKNQMILPVGMEGSVNAPEEA